MNNKCKRGSKPQPTNKQLYASATKKVKSRVKIWPSAYASGQVVSEYKRRGGKYSCSSFGGTPSRCKNMFDFGLSGLARWFKERWVNVCSPTKVPCGTAKQLVRNLKGTNRVVPTKKPGKYCRPSVRVNSRTPTTVGELTPKKRRSMCSKKRANPKRKVFL